METKSQNKTILLCPVLFARYYLLSHSHHFERGKHCITASLDTFRDAVRADEGMQNHLQTLSQNWRISLMRFQAMMADEICAGIDVQVSDVELLWLYDNRSLSALSEPKEASHMEVEEDGKPLTLPALLDETNYRSPKWSTIQVFRSIHAGCRWVRRQILLSGSAAPPNGSPESRSPQYAFWKNLYQTLYTSPDQACVLYHRAYLPVWMLVGCVQVPRTLEDKNGAIRVLHYLYRMLEAFRNDQSGQYFVVGAGLIVHQGEPPPPSASVGILRKSSERQGADSLTGTMATAGVSQPTERKIPKPFARSVSVSLHTSLEQLDNALAKSPDPVLPDIRGLVYWLVDQLGPLPANAIAQLQHQHAFDSSFTTTADGKVWLSPLLSLQFWNLSGMPIRMNRTSQTLSLNII